MNKFIIGAIWIVTGVAIAIVFGREGQAKTFVFVIIGNIWLANA